MITKKRHIASILILFLCLMSGKINAQERLKLEKKWLIDYYFKDDTAFNNRLTFSVNCIINNERQKAFNVLNSLKYDRTDSLKGYVHAYYRAFYYYGVDKERSLAIIDSMINLNPIFKIKYARYYLAYEYMKINSISVRITEDKKPNTQKKILELLHYAHEVKDCYHFLKISQRLPWFIDYRMQLSHGINIDLVCLKLSDLLGAKSFKSRVYSDLLYFSIQKGNLQDFYKYTFLALKLNEESNDVEAINKSYFYFADMYYIVGEYNLASSYVIKNIILNSKIKKIENLSTNLSLYAKILFSDKKNEKSLKFDSLAIKLSNLQTDTFVKIICKNGYYRNQILSKSKIDTSEKKELQIYFKDVNDLLNKAKDTPYYRYSVSYNFYINYAKFLQVSGKYKASLDTALSISEIFHGGMVGSDEILDNYKIIYDDYIKLGDYKNANEYLEKYYHHIDSIKSELNVQNIVRNEIEYEAEKTKKKEELEKSLEKEKALIEVSRDKNIQAITRVSIVFLIIILFFGLYFYRQKSKSEKMLSHLNNELYTKNIEIQNTLEYTHKMEKDIILQKIETQNKESEFQLAQAELKALRSQMNPHFLFNAINSIQSYMLKNDSLQASKYLTKFARLIRSVLENSKQEFVLLSTEISTLELYVELEAMRSSFEFDYEFVLEDGMISSDYLIPPMIIQPYVENAILHGITQLTDRRGNLIISFSIENQILKCVVDDNGIGRKEAMEIKAAKDINRKSIGLEVTNNRIEILNKHNKMFAKVNIIDKFDIDNKALGTKVEIEITLNKAV